MNITREHLELAAKAIGKKAVFRPFGGGEEVAHLVPIDAPPERNLLRYPLWMPDCAPGDAAQLAEDCKMSIDFAVCKVFFLLRMLPEKMDFGGDTGITWMQAVTLAAAEIGRAMK